MKIISKIMSQIMCLGKIYELHVPFFSSDHVSLDIFISILANTHKSFKRSSSVQFINALNFNIFGLE